MHIILISVGNFMTEFVSSLYSVRQSHTVTLIAVIGNKMKISLNKIIYRVTVARKKLNGSLIVK